MMRFERGAERPRPLQVLLLLAHAYGCSPGNEQRARNCAEALRQLEGQAGQAGGSVAGQFFLAQALLRGGR